MAKRVLRDLTPKEMTFVRSYLQTGSPYAAWEAAGYSKGATKWWYNKAKLLLKEPKIQMAIAGIMEERKERIMIDIQFVIDGFVNTYNACMEQKDNTNANRALENLAKYLGMYTGKGENVSTPKDPAELRKDIIRFAQAAGATVDFNEIKATK